MSYGRGAFSSPGSKIPKEIEGRQSQTTVSGGNSKNPPRSHRRNEENGDLNGIYGYDIYYNHTNYELAYTIETATDGETIIVIMAGTRENFYDQLKKYFK